MGTRIYTFEFESKILTRGKNTINFSKHKQWLSLLFMNKHCDPNIIDQHTNLNLIMKGKRSYWVRLSYGWESSILSNLVMCVVISA